MHQIIRNAALKGKRMVVNQEQIDMLQERFQEDLLKMKDMIL